MCEMKLLDKVGLYDLNQNLKVEIFNRHYWFIWAYIVKSLLLKIVSLFQEFILKMHCFCLH